MNNFENILKNISDFTLRLSHIMLQKKRSRMHRAIATGMACVVVFVTTYSLIIPAITLENSVATEMPGVYFEDMSDVINISEESDYNIVPSEDTDDETWFENGSDTEAGDETRTENDDTEWTDTDDAWMENGSEEWTDTDAAWAENDASELTETENSGEEWTNDADILTEDDTAMNDDSSADAWIAADESGIDAELEDSACHLDAVTPLDRIPEGVTLGIDFPAGISETAYLFFEEITELYNNYYSGAMEEISRVYPESNTNLTVSAARFFKVDLMDSDAAESMLATAAFEFDPALYADENTAPVKVLVVSCEDGQWTIYDEYDVLTDANADGGIFRVTYDTEDLSDGHAEWGVVVFGAISEENEPEAEDTWTETEPAAESFAEEAEMPEVEPEMTESVAEEITEVTESAAESMVEEVTEVTESATESMIEEIAEVTESTTESMVEEIAEVTESTTESMVEEIAEATESTTESMVEEVAEATESTTESMAEEFAEPTESVKIEGVAGSRTIEVPGADYVLHVSYDADAGIPENAEFIAVPVESDDYAEQALSLVNGTVAEDGENRAEQLDLMGLFDLTVYADGKVIAPQGQLRVSVEFVGGISENEEIYAVHFPGTGEQPEAEDVAHEAAEMQNEAADEAAFEQTVNEFFEEPAPAMEAPAFRKSMKRFAVPAMEEAAVMEEAPEMSADVVTEASEAAEPEVIPAGVTGTEAEFEVSGLSYIAVVRYTVLTTSFLSESGQLYEVTVTYGNTARIPEGSTLRVVEFSEEDAEYEYARNSVLADKKARGESVDLSSFGLAAVDISILNPDGAEIEPEAPVQVEILIKELPGVEDLSEVADTLAIQHHVEAEDGVVVETVYDGNTDASFELKTNETVVEEGIVVDPGSVSEEDFAEQATVEAEGLDVGFEAAAFSTFTISWNYAYGNGVKVHYVDQNGNELTVKNSKFLNTLNSNSTSPAYLIYDIDGYEYDQTYHRYYTGGGYGYSAGWYYQNIVPQLRRNNNGWTYSTNSSNWYYLSESNTQRKDEIYVVYKKKADAAQGGTPTVKQSGDVDPPVAPRINKESTPNGDDTNTLALSIISDTAKLEVEKLADVIVVFDVSGSMNDRMGGSTRLQAAKTAVNNLAEQLSTKKNSAGEPLVRMSLISFSTKASAVIGMTDLTTRGTNNGLKKIKDAVNGLSANGGTNWDHALQLANEENDLDSGRATFVIFVTDGDPTFRNTRMNVTDAELQGETNDAGGTYNPYYLSSIVYGPGDNDKTGQCYDAAVLQGSAIVSAGKNIYTIGISNDVTKVQTFNSDIHGNGAYLAADSGTLNQAFADIETSISGVSGWGNIKMTDGITNLSNTVQKTGLTNVGGDFSYWMAPAPANWAGMTEAEKNAYKPAASDFVSWDPASAGAAAAVYNRETGAVEWNMGSRFMPEAGVTYQVRFKVWPSQEAYDYIAKLNNGTINYDTLPADVQAQIIKSGNTYTLKTNEPDARTTYQSATRTGDTVTTSGDVQTLMFPRVEDLNLSVDRMKVTKEWKNDLDPDARWKSDVTLLLTDGAGNLYKSIDLNEDNHYTEEDNFISCGLAKIENNELVIYEKGHDFRLSEPEEYAYYWDLDSQIYRPMIINAQLTMLVKADAPSGMGDKTYFEDQGTKYYRIEGGTYKAISTGDAAAAITATNIRRSNLNLTKRVVDKDGAPAISSEMFTFNITINDSRDDQVWFSVQTDANDTATIVKDLSTNATPEEKDGVKTGYYYANSGSVITVSIQPGWNLRFTNLPNGTTYTITEDNAENYSFLNAVIDNNGTFSVKEGTTEGNGTISKSNTQYTVTYTNTAATQQVFIKKTGQDAQKPLKGAEFSLYTKEGYEAEPKKVMKADLVSDENGNIDLGRLVVGEYYLEETQAPAGYNLLTEPVEITVKKNGVQYRQITNSLSMDNQGVSGDNENGYTLIVTNSEGIELPATGGPGTMLIYLLGLMMMGFAGLMLMMRGSRRAV